MAGDRLRACYDQNPEPSVAEQLRAWPSPEVRFRCAGELDLARTLPAASRLRAGRGGRPRPHGGEGRRSHLLEIEVYLADGQLSVQWTYSPLRHRGDTISSLAEEFLAACCALVRTASRPRAGYTPSDFPLAGLDQRTLDQLVLMVEDGAEEGLE